ncbi:MAG TPA: C4-dicarboxylate transporter DctA, partial [Phycisphaerae bacterium]|nr:C4-dicarboxylate transporter DctA [Phycisphaerae bacterium]
QLYVYVLLGFALGILVGILFPAFSADHLKILPDLFIKLVRMVLVPIVFCTVVLGIARMGDLKSVGRIGIKAILYFEVATTLALAIGLIIVNLVQPGAGMNAKVGDLDPKPVESFINTGKSQTLVGFFMDIVPTSIGEAFVKGDMLQVIFFSLLFGVALGRLPNRGKPLVDVLDTTVHALFKIVGFITLLAPLAALGAMAFTIGKYGLDTLRHYASLVACVYTTSVAFVIIVLGIACWLAGIPLWKFLRYIKDEILLTFATASSETAFPGLVQKLERMGCSKPVVGIVLPAGYTFNADGSCIYMTMAAIFLAQATGTPLTLGDQIIILVVCLFTSKGAAGVSGAGFIALAATLASMNKIPVASLVLIFGVDRFLSEARAVINMIGNAVATVVVARWENALDLPHAKAVLASGPSPHELPATEALHETF